MLPVDPHAQQRLERLRIGKPRLADERLEVALLELAGLRDGGGAHAGCAGELVEEIAAIEEGAELPGDSHEFGECREPAHRRRAARTRAEPLEPQDVGAVLLELGAEGDGALDRDLVERRALRIVERPVAARLPHRLERGATGLGPDALDLPLEVAADDRRPSRRGASVEVDLRAREEVGRRRGIGASRRRRGRENENRRDEEGGRHVGRSVGVVRKAER